MAALERWGLEDGGFCEIWALVEGGSDGRQVYKFELGLIDGADFIFGTDGRPAWAECTGRISRALGH